MGIKSTVIIDLTDAEHINKLIWHEIHRLRWRLSAPYLPEAEKLALAEEMFELEDIGNGISEQL